MKTVKTIATALMIATIGLTGTAQANQKFKMPDKKPYVHYPHQKHGKHHKHDNYMPAAAGLFGFAAGAMVGSALAQQQQPRVVYVQPGQDWVAYCYSKYRSYNPATNLYLAYDGYYRECR
jgi:hypothetical protein